MKPKINISKEYYELNIPQVKKKFGKGLKYIGDFCIKNIHREWTDTPVAVFYQPFPDVEKGHSEYFGLFTRNGKLIITNAESFKSEGFTGVYNNDKTQILISGWRHDYKTLEDGTMIDGGRDYCRYSSLHALVKLKVVKDKFIIEK